MDNKKTLSLLEKYLKTNMKTTKMRNVDFYIDKSNHEYSDYTIEEFLILSKLERMEELGYISEDISKTLHEMLEMKIKIDESINISAIRKMNSNFSVSPDISKLIEKSNLIEESFKKYNLTVNDFNLTELLDLIIKSENSKQEEDINIKVKKLD